MPADQIARTTVAARLGALGRLSDDLRVYAELEYPREDVYWLRAVSQAPAESSPARTGWLSRSWGSRLLARNPATEVEGSIEPAAP